MAAHPGGKTDAMTATPLPRDEFPVCRRWNYLNHAGVNALPAGAAREITRYAHEAAEEGSLAVEAHEARVEEVRAAAAALLGVTPAEVAFVKNTTEGLGFVANGLEWREGDRVVVPDLEFPSTLYPWTALGDRGVIVDRVQPVGAARALPVAAFAEVIDAGPAPRVVCTSWVQFGRGWRTDLAAVAEVTHAAGALLCVDAIQGLGVVPAELDAWGVDFAMADAHKWLLGPSGIGVLYVRASELERLRPLEPGWASVAHREQWDNLALAWDPGARRLEGGSANTAGLFGLGAALDLLSAAGVAAVWEHVRALGDRAAAGLAAAGAEVLSDRSPGGASGIVTFAVPSADPGALVERLRGAGIVCSPRGGGVRISPHGYNTAAEMDDLVAAVGRAA